MQNSTVPRLYHSVATLLADGSVLTAGSNPNADYIAPGTAGYPYVTEYRAEKFYPSYFTSTRPTPTGLPTTLAYGGSYFNVTLNAADIKAKGALDNTFISVVRPGYSTHAMNMGQRFLQLNNTYTINSDGSATLHVSQMPPNAAIFPPGPAFVFCVVNGVPSQGGMVMVGNGQIGKQPVAANQDLPGTLATQSGSSSGSSSSTSSNATGGGKSPAARVTLSGAGMAVVAGLVGLVGLVVCA